MSDAAPRRSHRHQQEDSTPQALERLPVPRNLTSATDSAVTADEANTHATNARSRMSSDALQRVGSLSTSDPVLINLKWTSPQIDRARDESPKATFFRRPSTSLSRRSSLLSLRDSGLSARSATPLSDVSPPQLRSALAPRDRAEHPASSMSGNEHPRPPASQASSVALAAPCSVHSPLLSTPGLGASPMARAPNETPPSSQEMFEAHKELVQCFAPWTKRLRCDEPNAP